MFDFRYIAGSTVPHNHYKEKYVKNT